MSTVASKLEGPQINKKNKTVLICDDQEDILYVTAAFLKRKYNVLTAKSGAECIELVNDRTKNKGSAIDVILLDYKLRDMTGEEVARRIRGEIQNRKAVRILLITAYELDSAVLSKIHEENLIDAELKKPFGLSDLERKMTELVSWPV
ncbi:MAG TPA: response regulator [Nitrososphaerales archaeon]|nr:response regulator [Nitrososphaerales archaeon]